MEQGQGRGQNGGVRGPRKVLFWNRANAYTQRGGDTELMEQLAKALQGQGVEVTIDIAMAHDPRQFDMAHLFNFATPELLKVQAQRLVEAGVPYVVTTLCEDVAKFHNQSRAVAASLVEYVQRGQNRVWYADARVNPLTVPESPSFENSWVSQHAAALLSSGAGETAVLRRLYGAGAKVIEIPFGIDLVADARPDLFTDRYGITDFILCVGRLESRKNQLMLLKALEDCELPVVFVAGGFSYQPDYAEAVRRFARRGKTIVLDRLSPEELASAYAAARVHALPSWYELPGLVSLEAAAFGNNVVVTDTGSTRDYLNDLAFYCKPHDEESIYNAVLAAFYSPLKQGLADLARAYTWTRTARAVLRAYEASGAARLEPAASIAEAPPPDRTVSSATLSSGIVASATETNYLAEGEEAARRRQYGEAHRLLDLAEKNGAQSARAARAHGAVYLAEGRLSEARICFERALVRDRGEIKALSGLGMCALQEGNLEEAYTLFVQSLEQDGSQVVAILQLLDCSYRLSRFDALERVLRNFLADNPDDVEFRFCLGGCLFKREKYEEAHQELQKVLAAKPDHDGARDLLQLVATHRSAHAAIPQAATPMTAPSRPAPEMPMFAAPSAPPETRIAEKAIAQVEVPQAADAVEKLQQALQRFSASAASVQQPAAQRPSAAVTSGPAVSESAVQSSLSRLDHDMQTAIAELEEKKRRQQYAEVLRGVGPLLGTPNLRVDQREMLEALKADALVLSGDLVGGERIYDDILSRNPGSLAALCGKGALAAVRGDWVRAESTFRDVLESVPNHDVALAGLGLCRQCAGKKEEAWDLYLAATRRNAENKRALLGLIELGYALGRLEELEMPLRNYVDLHPANVDMQYTLAGCLYARKSYHEAEELVERILLLVPTHQNALELRYKISEAREMRL